jgi:beta-phosphoglucomutase
LLGISFFIPSAPFPPKARGRRGFGSVGSSTSVLNIQLCLEATGLDRFFGTNITGAEDVKNGKPAPDVFLAAAAKIERAPSQCLVIEDAHVGVEAGLAAGMKVLAVTTTHKAPTFGGKPHRIVDTLSEIKLQDLINLLSAV